MQILWCNCYNKIKADNKTQIVILDENINKITGVKAIVSDEKYKKFRNGKAGDGSIVSNIFGEYIGHRDNRSGGESIPKNTHQGMQN